MNSLTEDDEEAYKKLFSGYIEHGVEADDLEELYGKVCVSCPLDGGLST